jgi:hypothetical protein
MGAINSAGNFVARFPGTIGFCVGVAIVTAATYPVFAHPGSQTHFHIMKKPFSGVYNNYWYDYRSDVEEAESELRKDLRRAKTPQDKREAWAEYNQELRDARKDYAKEMRERGYSIPRGDVIVGG